MKISTNVNSSLKSLKQEKEHTDHKTYLFIRLMHSLEI